MRLRGRPAQQPTGHRHAGPADRVGDAVSGDVDTQAAAVLRSLDDLRERAFAARDASLLARVYRAGTLLAQDVALLERIVPKGCGWSAYARPIRRCTHRLRADGWC